MPLYSCNEQCDVDAEEILEAYKDMPRGMKIAPIKLEDVDLGNDEQLKTIWIIKGDNYNEDRYCIFPLMNMNIGILVESIRYGNAVLIQIFD